jgi:hypothetical protein
VSEGSIGSIASDRVAHEITFSLLLSISCIIVSMRVTLSEEVTGEMHVEEGIGGVVEELRVEGKDVEVPWSVKHVVT